MFTGGTIWILTHGHLRWWPYLAPRLPTGGGLPPGRPGGCRGHGFQNSCVRLRMSRAPFVREGFVGIGTGSFEGQRRCVW